MGAWGRGMTREETLSPEGSGEACPGLSQGWFVAQEIGRTVDVGSRYHKTTLNGDSHRLAANKAGPCLFLHIGNKSSSCPGSYRPASPPSGPLHIHPPSLTPVEGSISWLQRNLG